MTNRNKIYSLLLNEQTTILELLKLLDIDNPKEKIKNILDNQLFEIIECSDLEILKIRKKSTNEIFTRGGKFWNKKYNKWIEDLYFDESLFGVHYHDIYYKNYVRAGIFGELHHLSDISTTDKMITTKDIVWKPTMNLQYSWTDITSNNIKRKKVLQQMWINDLGEEEWRNINIKK